MSVAVSVSPKSDFDMSRSLRTSDETVVARTQTIESSIYTAIEQPDGDAAALRLTPVSAAIAIAALVASELLARRSRTRASVV